MTKEKCTCGQTNNNRTCKYHFPITGGVDVSNKLPNKEDEKKYQIDSTKLDFSKNIMEQEPGVITVSLSDKTWKERFDELCSRFTMDIATYRSLFEKKDFEKIEDFIQQELTSATIKAKEEERQFILNILDGTDEADRQMGNTGGGTKAIRHALQSRIIDGNLEEPSK